MNKIFTVLTILVLFFQLYGTAQNLVVQFPLKIQDTNGASDTLLYGNATLATYGIDAIMGEYGSPPDPPGFFAKFIGIPGRVNTWGSGIIPNDFRTLPLSYSPLHEDTFLVAFKNDNPDAFNATATLRWPPAAYLGVRCDSSFIVDPTHTILPNRIDMMTQDSVNLPGVYDPNGINPAAPNFKFYIFVYGVKVPLVSVHPDKGLVPGSYALYQNYPNPFNPGTTIQYDLPKSSDVSLKIYNTLGQEMATLVSGHREAGRYYVDFDASRFTSGIYIYRIITKEYIETRKMLLIK